MWEVTCSCRRYVLERAIGESFWQLSGPCLELSGLFHRSFHKVHQPQGGVLLLTHAYLTSKNLHENVQTLCVHTDSRNISLQCRHGMWHFDRYKTMSTEMPTQVVCSHRWYMYNVSIQGGIHICKRSRRAVSVWGIRCDLLCKCHASDARNLCHGRSYISVFVSIRVMRLISPWH